MTWLALVFAIEIGWAPGIANMYEKVPIPFTTDVTEQVYITSVDRILLSQSFFTTLFAQITLFDFFYVSGNIKTFIYILEDKLAFLPHAVSYNFELGLLIVPLSVFWKHNCIHPVMPYAYWYEPELKWEGSYDEVGIRLEARIGGIR